MDKGVSLYNSCHTICRAWRGRRASNSTIFKRFKMNDEQNEQITITAYVNERGVVSPIKTIGFEPVELTVHQNYRILGQAGKALFRNNAYKELQDAD